jgi:D-arabinose 1-dehydrogenase-like Zn-dependent alcohol dehydrogenase
MTHCTKAFEMFLSPFPMFIELYGKYYKGVVGNEIELGNISCDDMVLCIGGGPLPCTAIEIAKHTGARVHVIDNDPCAVKIAKLVVEKLRLKDKIKVMLADGESVDIQKYSVVHIALQVFPKDTILKNILNKASIGTKVLMRMPKDGLKCLYSKAAECSEINSCKCIEQNKRCTMKATLLFIKEDKNRHEKKDTAVYHRSYDRNNTSVAV